MEPVVAVTVSAAYLLGTFPSALVVGRRAGFDPTRAGSGNPGASNAYRLGGRRAGALVLLADMAKAAIAAGAGYLADGRNVALAAGAAAVVGHVAPITRRFRGGKGVATAAGVALVVEPIPALALGLVFAAVARISRRASVASLVVTLLLPLAVALAGRPIEAVATWAAIAGLVAVRHTDNVLRLARGEEVPLSGATVDGGA